MNQFKVTRRDFTSGNTTYLGACATFDDALALAQEFIGYDWSYIIEINGTDLLEWAEKGLVH